MNTTANIRNHPVQPLPQSNLYWAIADTLVLTKRNLLNYARNLEDVVSATIQPILFVLIFRYVFGGAVNVGDTNYANYLMAGILVQAVALTSMATAIGLAQDLHTGLIDRFRSLPMSRSSVLAARTVATIVRNIFVLIVVLIVGLLVGLRPQGDALGWLAAAGLLLLFGFAVSWVGVAFGLVVRSLEAVQNISLTLVMPLTFLSSAFVPTQTMPNWLRIFADNQPMTHVINTVRSLLLDRPLGSSGWLAVAWSVGITVVFVPLAVSAYRRTTSS
jgi:ABC transporter DrrB family efflux protein